MRQRFLVAAFPPARRPPISARIEAAAAKAGLRPLLDVEDVLFFASGGAIPLGAQGFVLGSLFVRGSAVPAERLCADDQEAALKSRGDWFVQACWGGYVAVMARPGGGRLDVLRAPFGDLPCYLARRDGVTLCASDIQLLFQAGEMRASLDPGALARHLAAADVRRRETCLEGIQELPGGERLTIINGETEQVAIWSPWTFASLERQILDPAEAAARVGAAARHCVAARSSAFEHTLLKLSGGLDSSIVASSLAAAERPFTCLTLVTSDPAGDERHHARRVADALGAPLLEVARDPAKVDVTRSSAARLPRPTARSFMQESDRIASAAARQVGAGAILDGGGGDNIFCSMKSVRPAVDALRVGAGAVRFLATAVSLARLAEVSLWTVAGRALLATSRGLSAYRWPLDLRCLSADAKRAAGAPLDHPWLQAPTRALPGKAAHVALITAAQSVAEGPDPQEEIPTLSPLISQPLVESCLQLPTWLWFGDGMNRWIARNAFAEGLPAETAFRRSKGSPDSFLAEIYEANRALLREMLAGGVLARLGLLDLPQLLRTLDSPGPLRGHNFLRVMQLADCEAWARSWAER